MELSKGKLNFIKEKEDLSHVAIYSFDWDYEINYHLAFNVRLGSIKGLEFAPSPFNTTQNNVVLYRGSSTADSILFDQLLEQNKAPTTAIASITFKTKPATGTYLGFHDPEYSMPNPALNWSLDADEKLTEAVSFTDLLVELPNLTMESYDGSQKKKRPIICYIPSLSVYNNELVYNANFPVMIDLKNNSTFNLSRIQVRLLTSNPEKVKIENSTIVVLLE